VCSPLRKTAWRCDLAGHAEKCFSQYILQGIQYGFRIGYDRHHYLMPATSNLKVDNPQAVTEYLSREVTLGRMWKVYISTWLASLQKSSLGLIPRKNKPGKWRLIVDVPVFPQGRKCKWHVAVVYFARPPGSTDSCCR